MTLMGAGETVQRGGLGVQGLGWKGSEFKGLRA